MERVNLNTATELELQRIIHIGPVRAKRIIERRLNLDERRFRDIHELSTIGGLGTIRMREILEQGVAEV